MLRRIHSILLLLALLIGAAGMNYVQAQTSGSCGTNVTWTLSDGVLTISGTGEMASWSAPSHVPWSSRKNGIRKVVVESGVTSIGNLAFYECGYLTSAQLPSGLTTIRFGAFYHTGLTSITIPNSVTTLGSAIFQGCYDLTNIYVSWTENIPAWTEYFTTKSPQSSITLHVPCGTKSLYQAANGWKNYTLTETTIGGNCGANGDNLTWLLSCDGVLTISGSGAMADYTTSSTSPWYSHRNAITSVTIADGITSIGSYAFNSCTNLQSVTIPPSLTAVGGYAFNDCFAMDKLYITDLTAWCNISFTGNYSTPFCRNCYSTHRGGGNLYVNGVKVTTLRIPDGITAIKDYTFLGFAGVTSLQLNQVITIGDYAFRGCIALTSLTIPEGVTTIGTSAFHYNIKLETLTIPGSVTFMGSKTFDFCNILTDIYVSWNTSSSIPQWPTNFTTKSPQTDITLHIPCGTASLYQAADGWKSYTIVEGKIYSGTCGPNLTWRLTTCDSTLTISGTGAMTNYIGTSNPSWQLQPAVSFVRNLVIEEGVTSIGTWAFKGCTEIEHVEIPSSVTAIKEYAFLWASNLESITIPEGVVAIEKRAFEGCSKLQNISLPNTLETIGTYCFLNCDLHEIVIPQSVSEIGSNALKGSSALTDIYVSWESADAIPTWTNMTSNDPQSGVTLHVPCGKKDLYEAADGWKDYTIVEEPMKGTCGAEGGNLTWTLSCDSVLTISGTGAMVDYTGTEAPWYQYKASIRTVVVEEGVTTIGSHAFNQIQKITTVSFPNTLISVGDYAFWGGKLTSLPLPNSLVSIGNSAFAQNRATSLAIGSNVTSIGDNAFGVGSNLASIGVDPGNTVFDSREDCNALIETSSNTLVKGCKNTIIPNTVTSLNISAFAGNTQLTSITIPGSIAVIPNRAFSACTALASVVLEEGVQTINNEAFLNCTPLATVKLPSSLRNLGQRAFIGNSLTDMYVAWTENIPGWPFQFSIKTANLHVPCGTEAVYQAADGWKDYNIIDEIVSGTCGAQGNNVTWTLCDSILTITGTGEMADYTNTNNLPWVTHRDAIKTIIVEDGITAIGDRAFGYSTNATSVSLPSSVTSIGDYAFISCSSLQEITIPNTIDALGTHMLYACGSLTEIYVSWTSSLPECPTNFTNKSPQSDITLHVPCEAIELYNAADGWKDYTIEGEGGPYTVTVQAEDPTMGDVSIVVN